MDHVFWHERWQQNQIGFHSEAVNIHLQNYWPVLQINKGGKVFVPLCGKSNDMLWLREQGYEVVAIELSPLAVQAFFADNNLSPSISQIGPFTVSKVDGLSIYCGDFFQFSFTELGEVQAVWDRASLVALPPALRVSYAAHMQQLLQPGTQTLLVAFDYPQQEMQGPPFCVTTPEIQALYGPWCEMDLICSEDILDREPHFRDRGLSIMQEKVYKLSAR